MIFTKQQIEDWRSYEKVRLGGRFNMFDPRAMREAKLNREQFIFCMVNYTELKEASEKAKP
jgi:hypothetical protein